MPIVGRGAYNPQTDRLNRETGVGNTSPAYSFGAQVAEVDVNLESGHVKVTRMSSAIDCGVAIIRRPLKARWRARSPADSVRP